MARDDSQSDELVERAALGDRAAGERLLMLHRNRLKKLISIRLDPRLAARIDPSDVVQDTLLEASQRLADYLRKQPVPFYPWLRGLAIDRMLQLQRNHVHAKRRSVKREARQHTGLSHASAAELADRLFVGDHTPHSRLQREELLAHVRAAMEQLSERDREVLILRYLEQLSTRDTAAVLGVGESAVKMRHLRAVQHLRELLDEHLSES